MANDNLRVIITGATGMVGEGVLMQCLESVHISEVLVINRRPVEREHPKLKEIIHKDFFDFAPIEDQLNGYDACFFCLGVSSLGLDKEKYYHLTYDLTLHVAETLSRHNPEMVFCYVSGAGTDSTEEKGMHWARVKGKTENDLMKLRFRQVYAMRPGFIKPKRGQRNVHKLYKYLNWLFAIGRLVYPSGFCRMEELARAMISLVRTGYNKPVIEGKDIISLGM